MPEALLESTPTTLSFSKILFSIIIFFSWRVLFKEILEQLKEIDESYRPAEERKKEDVKFDNFEDTENERKRKQVKMEPQMDFTIDN